MTIPDRLAYKSTSDWYASRNEDTFTFGLWTLGNQARDLFEGSALNLVGSVKKLAELGAWNVNFHANDLVPFHAAPAEYDHIVHNFKQICLMLTLPDC